MKKGRNIFIRFNFLKIAIVVAMAFFVGIGCDGGKKEAEQAPVELIAIRIIPKNSVVPLGKTKQFTATGVYTDNSIKDITTRVSWVSSTTSVATVSNAKGKKGAAITVGTGTTTIAATLGKKKGSVKVTVSDAELVSIIIGPKKQEVYFGRKKQFTAKGTYTDGSTKNFTDQVTWSSSDTSVAIVSNAKGKKGVATSVNTGTTTITAILGNLKVFTQLIVKPVELVSINIAPMNPEIPWGKKIDGYKTVQFTAKGLYTDGITQDITTHVTWKSSKKTIAKINSNGLVTAAGYSRPVSSESKNLIRTTISASLENITNSTQLAFPESCAEQIYKKRSMYCDDDDEECHKKCMEWAIDACR